LRAFAMRPSHDEKTSNAGDDRREERRLADALTEPARPRVNSGHLWIGIATDHGERRAEREAQLDLEVARRGRLGKPREELERSLEMFGGLPIGAASERVAGGFVQIARGTRWVVAALEVQGQLQSHLRRARSVGALQSFSDA